MMTTTDLKTGVKGQIVLKSPDHGFRPVGDNNN